MILKKAHDGSAETAAKILKNGGIAILPTDTVYGFSGIVDTAHAGTAYRTDARIREIKGREENKPLIQLLARPQDIFLYTDDVLPSALLEKWPGALTIIVRLKRDAPLAEKPATVAFRCPGDEWLRRVITLCDAPVFSTSVNRSGRPVLQKITAIRAEFAASADLIIDDGDKTGSLPSTLVALENGTVKVLRQGTVKI